MPTVRLMNNTGMHRVRRVCRVVLRAHEQDEHTGAELWEAKRHVEDCKSRTHRASHEQVKRAAYTNNNKTMTIPIQWEYNNNKNNNNRTNLQDMPRVLTIMHSITKLSNSDEASVFS
jgi:hypothetical protein